MQKEQATTLGTHQPCSAEERERERERESARDLRGVGLGTGSPEEGKPRDKIGLDSAGLHNTVQ